MPVGLFYAIYCLEAGLFFTIVPWTRIWTLNPVLHHYVSIALWADNPFVRGFVSGFGIIHLILGINELAALSRARVRGRQ